MPTRLTFAALIVLPLGFASTPAPACSTEPLIGSICAFAGNFAPRGYVPADGRLLAISENLALYGLLGTMYGGDGVTTFALPDLRGRMPIGMGQGPGLSTYEQGQTGGAESITLDVSQLPAHTHAATVKTTATQTTGNTNMPAGAVWATDERDDNYYTGQVTDPVEMAPDSVEVTVESTGQSKAIDNRQPYLTVRWLIALRGVFPSRQ